MDIEAYQEYESQSDFFSPYLFCLQSLSSKGLTFARHFGVPPDTLEDPFTGSASGGMGGYLWKYGLMTQPQFYTEQGHWLGRPGEAYVEVIGPPDDIALVRVVGQSITVMEGEIVIP